MRRGGVGGKATEVAIHDKGLAVIAGGGIATAGETPVTLAHYLGITPTWIDGTAVGGCSFMIHVRNAAAAINEGLCKTVLITHGESGKSRIAASLRPNPAPGTLGQQFEVPYGVVGPPTMFPIPVLRYLKTYGITQEQLAMVLPMDSWWLVRDSGLRGPPERLPAYWPKRFGFFSVGRRWLWECEAEVPILTATRLRAA